MKKKQYEVFIVCKTWKIRVHSPKYYARTYGPGSAGCIVVGAPVIHIRQDCMTVETIVHELTHAYAMERSVIELQLNRDQHEEFFCEVNAKHGWEMQQIAKDVFNFFGGNK